MPHAAETFFDQLTILLAGFAHPDVISDDAAQLAGDYFNRNLVDVRPLTPPEGTPGLLVTLKDGTLLRVYVETPDAPRMKAAKRA